MLHPVFGNLLFKLQLQYCASIKCEVNLFFLINLWYQINKLILMQNLLNSTSSIQLGRFYVWLKQFVWFTCTCCCKSYLKIYQNQIKTETHLNGPINKYRLALFSFQVMHYFSATFCNNLCSNYASFAKYVFR
jgi:hypothetical protein